MIDLNPSHLGIVKQILAKHLPKCEVRAFGSRVTWNAKEYSDLDLAIVGTGPVDWKVRGRLKEAFEESDLPIRVDVLDWHTITENFRQVIDRDCLVLQEEVKQIPTSKWPRVAVAEFSRVVIGGTPSRKVAEYWNGDIPWATAKDIAAVQSRHVDHVKEFITELGLNSSAAKLMPEGTVVITARGTVGALAQLRYEMAFNQTCYAILPQEEIDRDYLFYALKGTLSEMRALTYGTVFETITRRTFENWKIPLPPLIEQRAIAHILRNLDDKIELNRRMNETLESMARALFKSWFVDFDPVRAKMAGRESYLPPELWALFPGHLVESELGAIPEGWEVKTMGDLASIVGGSTPSTKRAEYWDEGEHKWATPKDLSALSVPVLLDTERKITDAGLRRVGSGLQPPGTVFLSSRAPVGYLAINEAAMAINQGFIAIRPMAGISNLFLLQWCAVFIDEISNYANGSTFPEISKTSFRGITLVKPSAAVLDAYHRMASYFHQALVANELSSRTIAAQRDTILPRLMSGELGVRSLEDCPTKSTL